MITRTAREIIKNARYLAGLRNSELTDFYSNVLLLNNAYTQVIIDASENDVFTSTVELMNGDALPSNCMKINSVTTTDNHIFTDYKIINNVLYTKYDKPLTVLYSVVPSTLTAPDVSTKLDIPNYATNLLLTDEYLYYTADSNYYAYNLETGDITTTSSYTVPTTFLFCDKLLQLKNNTVVDTEGNPYFEKEDTNVINFCASGNYAFVTYIDNSIRIYSDFYNYADYNYNCIKGQPTKGYILTACVDETTGKGVIFQDTDMNIYYSSFVPDTILEWPNNILYQLVEYKLATILLGLVGLDSSMQEKQYKELLVYFYKTVNIDSNSNTIRNILW